MSKAIIIGGIDSKDMLPNAAIRTKDKLTEHTNLNEEDIYVILGSLDTQEIIKQLEQRLELQKPDEPLMLIYMGYGNSEGWTFTVEEQFRVITYVDLAKLLGKYSYPIHFVNAAYNSTAALPAFKKILGRNKNFGMITPYGAAECGWPGYVVEVIVMFFFDLHIPYDHAVWKENWNNLTFGFVFDKPGLRFDKRSKCMRFTVNGKFCTSKLTSAKIAARHGKILDNLFWTFDYKNNIDEYNKKIAKYLRTKIKRQNQRKKSISRTPNLDARITLQTF